MNEDAETTSAHELGALVEQRQLVRARHRHARLLQLADDRLLHRPAAAHQDQHREAQCEHSRAQLQGLDPRGGVRCREFLCESCE